MSQNIYYSVLLKKTKCTKGIFTIITVKEKFTKTLTVPTISL